MIVSRNSQKLSWELATLFLQAAVLVPMTTVAEANGSLPNDHIGTNQVSISVVDEKSRPLPCRIHLKGPNEKPVQPNGLPFWKDHFCCPGSATLQLASGQYHFEIERGPEFERISGTFDVTQDPSPTFSLTLRRLTNLAKQGWYAGDLHVHRAPDEMPLLLAAEDLHVAPVVTWWNDRNPWSDSAIPKSTLQTTDDGRYYDLLAGEDERGGGALLYFGLKHPLAIVGSQYEHPCSLSFLLQAKQDNPHVWVEIEKPFWKDVPLWLASGEINSIGIAHNHLWREGGLHNEAWGRPRDQKRWSGPQGNGRWTQQIYYHTLNCGFRIPPSAGSASGVLDNPVGYNRCYVYTGEGFTYSNWWDAFRSGRVFVTNGPLLLATANHELPGHVFSEGDLPAEISIEGTVTSFDPISTLEVIQDGRVVEVIDGEGRREFDISTNVKVTEPGWFLLRAITNHPDTFRFASTGPFYVETKDGNKKLRRQSVQFFLAWAEERCSELATLLESPEKDDVLVFHDRAIRVWRDLDRQAE